MLNKKIKNIIKEKYVYFYEKYFQKLTITTTAIIFAGVVGFLVLYYIVFGLAFNSEIRKDNDVKIPEIAGLSTIGVAGFIIDQEVQKNLWTPSLPVFFPTYFLDNLPNFQLGEMDATSKIVQSLSALAKDDKRLEKAAKFLSYDGDIWMFDKSGVLPVPSSASQYKKGLQVLRKANPLAHGLLLDETSLLYLLTKITKDINTSLKVIDTSITEDIKTDDTFYYNQGKIYVYSLLLKAISVDYKAVLVEKEMYADMTYVIKALEDAIEVSPFVVRNSDKSSSSANHLYSMSYYIQKALLRLDNIKDKLMYR